MKKDIFAGLLAAAAISCSGNAFASTSGDFLSDLLGKVTSNINVSNVVNDVIDGVFTKDDLTVADIVGTWQSTGPAVSFRSEDLLKKAGGAAITSTIQQKIDPYYKKYGLNKAVITITEDGNISLSSGKYNLTGTIKVNDDKKYAGNFLVTFKALGIMSLGTFDTYISIVNNPLSSGKELKIMFDAQKLIALMKSVAALSKSSVANSVTKFVESYDGVCLGFSCTPIVTK